MKLGYSCRIGYNSRQQGERQIWNYQAEQPDASAWRLILLAAGR